MTIQIKDIQQLILSANTSGGAEFATAMPDGLGGYNLRKITKATALTYGADAIPTRNDYGSGTGRILNLKGAGVWLEGIGAAGAIFLRGATILGISPDGATIPARLESDGKVVGIQFVVTNGGNTYTVSYPGSSNQTGTLVESGVIQINPKTFVLEPTTGNTINVDNTQHAVVYVKPAGTIAALTINMPNAATEGRRVSFYFSQDITTITHNGTSGATILSPLTTATAGDRVTYIFQTTENVWIPIS